MVMVNGGPIGPDGVGGSYKNSDSDDRAALWQSLGGRQGLLSGGDLTVVPGSLSLSMAAFRASVEERDAAGNGLGRGYHGWSDDAVAVVFDPPSAQARNDAVVHAVADTSAGSGAFGTEVTEAGPQVIVVPGVSGTTTPRTDADIQTAVGAGGWVRLADVPVNPGDTEVGQGEVAAGRAAFTVNPDASATVAFARIEAAAIASIANDSVKTITLGTVARQNRSGFSPTTTSLTIPADGYYAIDAQIRWDAAQNTGYRSAQILIDGSPIAGSNTPAFAASLVNDFSSVHYANYLTAGQVITMQGYQNNGSAINLGGSPSDTFLQIRQSRE